MLARPRLVAALALLAAALLGGPPVAAQPGDLAGYPLLRLDASARAAALGGSVHAIDDGDVSGLFYNPALLTEAASGDASATYLNHLSDLNAGFLAYGHHLSGLGTVGAGLRFLSYGRLEGYDERGNETGDFGAADVALTLSAGRAVTKRLRLGLSLHALYSSIEAADALGLGVDLGALYAFPGRQLTLSASVNHLGASLDDFDEKRVRLPLDLRLGLSKKLAHVPLLLSLTGFNLNRLGAEPPGGSTLDDVLSHLALGGEFQLGAAFQARLGYSHRRHKELALSDGPLDLAGLGVGFGLRVGRLGMDYAFSSWSAAGGLHQLTLRAQLSKGAKH